MESKIKGEGDGYDGTIELEDLKAQSQALLEELMEAALKPGQIVLVVGCSSSGMHWLQVDPTQPAEPGMAAVQLTFTPELKQRESIWHPVLRPDLAVPDSGQGQLRLGLEPKNVVPQLRPICFATALFYSLEHTRWQWSIKAHAG